MLCHKICIVFGPFELWTVGSWDRNLHTRLFLRKAGRKRLWKRSWEITVRTNETWLQITSLKRDLILLILCTLLFEENVETAKCKYAADDTYISDWNFLFKYRSLFSVVEWTSGRWLVINSNNCLCRLVGYRHNLFWSASLAEQQMRFKQQVVL